MHTLISFLGKSSRDPKTGYRSTNYHFGKGTANEHIAKDTTFFGTELTKFIRPDKLILIGTAGSMWDVFFDQNTNNEQILNLIDEVAHNKVTELSLEPFITDIETKLGCNQVKFMVIDYAITEQEQINLLNRIAEELTEGDSISLDITHSLRHLPMLVLVASRFFKNVKNIQTEKIYYGALEMTDQESKLTPVIELNGMLKMLDWVDALSVYNHSGNYGVFSPLFAQEGEQKQAEYLKEATFFENINRTDKAKSNLDAFLAVPQSEKTLNNPMIQLFDEELKSRIKNVNDSDQFTRQFKLAKFYLDKKDYLRASILAQEAWISKMVKKYGGNQSIYRDRKNAKEEHFEPQEYQYITKNNGNKYPDYSHCTDDGKAFLCLSAIRNACAHATEVNDSKLKSEVTECLQNQEKLHKKLNDILKKIEQWQ